VHTPWWCWATRHGAGCSAATRASSAGASGPLAVGTSMPQNSPRKPTAAQIKKLRSRAWFDNPDNPDMTAIYLERYMNYGLTRDELRSGKPIIGIAQSGSPPDHSSPSRLAIAAAGACAAVVPSGRPHTARSCCSN